MSTLIPLQEIISGTSPLCLDGDGTEYLYVQVAEHVTARIAAGDLKPNERLPAERDLATSYGVSLGTARHATELLRQRGLVVTIRSKGTFVANSEPQFVGKLRG